MNDIMNAFFVGCNSRSICELFVTEDKIILDTMDHGFIVGVF